MAALLNLGLGLGFFAAIEDWFSSFELEECPSLKLRLGTVLSSKRFVEVYFDVLVSIDKSKEELELGIMLVSS